MSKNRVRLNICGTECAVMSDEPESYVRGLGAEIQKDMVELMNHNERVSITMAAIITALDCCDRAHKATDSTNNLRGQIKDYLEDSSRARMEAEESRREIERMKREIQTLRARLSGETDAPPPMSSARPIAPGSPVQRPQSGNPSQAHGREADPGFMSFFEKKTDE